ncbi:MAG TPA: RecX family transcriptional regulator, partial [Solirubrobacteraceae bacterium]
RFTEDRRALDGWGTDRIERRLLEVGVDRAEIAAALAQRDAGSELEAAVELLRRRFPAPPADERDRERALGLLVRKGYELELAYDAVRALGREAA